MSLYDRNSSKAMFSSNLYGFQAGKMSEKKVIRLTETVHGAG